MQEYTLGKNFEDINIIKNENSGDTIQDKYFSNQRPSKYEINNSVVNHCTFLNIGLKNSKIENVNFSHCVFIECYFKYSSILNVNFTNCRFIKCNFEDVNIVSTTFDYAKFHDCYIDYDKLVGNLPKLQNLRWKLCTNLALECLRLGNDIQFRQFYFAEKEASEQHYLAMFTKKDDYYKKHYSSWQSIEGLIKFLTSKTSKRLWGYGEKISYLVINIILTIIGFSIIYFFSGNIFKINGNPEPVSISFIDSIYVSVCNFATITSDITTSNHFIRNTTAIEGFIGIILMGFFVAALFRYINRR